MAIKVYIITTAHPWDDVRVTHRLARSFVDAGFQVDWFGPSPKDNFKELYGINFHFFENITGKLTRLKAPRKLRILLSKALPANVYFSVDPDSAPVASYFSNIYKAKSVFDVHEIYHREMLINWCPRMLIPIVGSLLKKRIAHICKKIDLVVGVGETRISPFKKYIYESMVVRHCVPNIYINNLQPRFNKNPNEIRIIQGKISLSQGSIQMLRAAKIAEGKTGKKILIVLFEIYSSELQKEKFDKITKEEGLINNIFLLKKISYGEMFPVLASCDIGVISYQRSMGINCMPNRVFEYMSVGLPVITPSYSIEMQDILSKYNCGVSADMENVNDIVSAICKIVNSSEQMKIFSDNSFKAFKEDLNWEKESSCLIDWIRRNN